MSYYQKYISVKMPIPNDKKELWNSQNFLIWDFDDVAVDKFFELAQAQVKNTMNIKKETFQIQLTAEEVIGRFELNKKTPEELGAHNTLKSTEKLPTQLSVSSLFSK
jgi:hypothetical protein